MKKKYAAQYAWKKCNRERVDEIARVWREANPDKLKKYYKDSYVNHRKKKLAKNKAYNKKIRKENPELLRERDRAYYRANPWRFVTGRQSSEMREVLFVLTGIKPIRGLSLEVLYDRMVAIIKKNPSQASKRFPFGQPDASVSKVEWKFGFDRLRGCQFVWDVLNGLNCKIRWASSCDDFEKAITGKKNGSKLFKSYRDFVIWRYGITNGR